MNFCNLPKVPVEEISEKCQFLFEFKEDEKFNRKNLQLRV